MLVCIRSKKDLVERKFFSRKNSWEEKKIVWYMRVVPAYLFYWKKTAISWNLFFLRFRGLLFAMGRWCFGLHEHPYLIHVVIST